MTMRINYEQRYGRINNTGNFGAGDNWVVPVVDKIELSFGSAGTTDINLAQNIPTGSWVSGVLVTRIYSQASFTGTFNIYVVNSFIADDDPATIFSPAVPTTTYVAKSNNLTSLAAGTLDVVALGSPAPIGPQLRVFAEFVASGAGKITLGVSLVGRPA